MSRDRIEIGGLRVLGTHGVLPEEQDRCQPFELDLAIEADLAAAGASDDLALTLDYGDLVETARRVVSSSRFQLLEALAEAVASAILEDVRVEAVTVGLRKLRPPLAADVSTVGVRLTREQSSHAGESVRAAEAVRVHLGLGSNLGDRLSELAKALATLRELDPALLVSSVYETAPVGGPSGQPPYLNCVVRLETALSPMEVLQLAQGLEHSARRVRKERFGPRTLDVDVLLVDAVTSDDPILTLPHPRMFERAFVLAPLEEIDPKLVPADWRERLGGATVIEGSVRSLGQLLGSSRARKTGTA